MIRNRSLIRIAVGAVAAAGLLAAQATSPAPGRSGPGRRANRLDRLATILNLTPDQKTQIGSILESSSAQARPLMSQMRTNREAIEQLVKSGTAENFDSQLQQLANQQGSLTSQLCVIHGKAMSQVWNLLNPDQRTKAEQLHELMGPGMMGGGMMGGGGPAGPGMHRHRMPPAAPPNQ